MKSSEVTSRHGLISFLKQIRDLESASLSREDSAILFVSNIRTALSDPKFSDCVRDLGSNELEFLSRAVSAGRCYE